MEGHRHRERRLVAMGRFPHKIGLVPRISLADAPLLWHIPLIARFYLHFLLRTRPSIQEKMLLSVARST
jgi:hypothetical protein